MTPEPYKIAVVMACHNRKRSTVQCLERLQAQRQPVTPPGFALNIYLLDDGCTDGTPQEVSRLWPNAHIITGDGTLFWCGGMRQAWFAASATDPDYFLLLNDDTEITEDALRELLALAPTPHSMVIAVATIADPQTGKVVCGGHKGHRLTPIQPKGIPVQCDTMNANCALVPRAVFRLLGGLHKRYTHGMGDYDYGFSATRRGVKVVQSGQVLGFSEPNSKTGSWRDTKLPRAERLYLLWFSPTKGLPIVDWCTYCSRNYGWQWPLKCISPTLRVLFGK